MAESFIRTMILLLLLAGALVVMNGGPVGAQEPEFTDGEIDILIQEFLPAAVTLADASPEEIEGAIFQAVALAPRAALRIVQRAIELRPDQAPGIASSAARSAPEQAVAIAAMAARTAPEQADEIAAAISLYLPEQAAAVQAAADGAARQAFAERTVDQIPDFFAPDEPGSPSIRDDRPASPVI